jgi:hypothetical protein
MTRKRPNPRSVTSARCRCGHLERLASGPDEPIVLDSEMNEYHLVRPKGGYWIVFHCPQCGGAAPASRRATRFAVLTDAEEDRLHQLTAGLESVAEAIKALGKPDHDQPHGLRIKTNATATKPAQVNSYRTLIFKRLSKTADVILTDYGVQGIRFTFQGKYLGKPRGRPTRS